jgi:pyruvate/oxaloacetate carboxyltransferase
MTTNQFRALVQGSYGKTPIAIDPAFRKQITGEAKEMAYDVSKHQSPANPSLPESEYGNGSGDGVKLAKDEKEYLLLELFPMVANGFLKGKRKAEKDAIDRAASEAEWAKINEANAKIYQGLEQNYHE